MGDAVDPMLESILQQQEERNQRDRETQRSRVSRLTDLMVSGGDVTEVADDIISEGLKELER